MKRYLKDSREEVISGRSNSLQIGYKVPLRHLGIFMVIHGSCLRIREAVKLYKNNEELYEN